MHNLHPNDKIYLHGVAVSTLDRVRSDQFIASRLAKGHDDLPCAVFTPNAEMLGRAALDTHIAELLNEGDLNTPDGVGVIWAAKKLGYPLPERVAGIELGEHTIAHCAAEGYRVFLLGGERGVADRAAESLKKIHPNLCICGTHHGYFDPDSEENEVLLKIISKASPDLLIVCLGFPRQERWVTENRPRLTSVKVMMALGGSLDVWSGRRRRAPRIIRRLKLEWLWRILREPSRIPRAAVLPSFVNLTLRAARVQKRNFKAKLS